MDNLKLLLGSSVQPPETDEEDLESQPEDASIQYDVADLVDAIGRPEFKALYLNSINQIRLSSIEAQFVYCRKILERVFEVFDFEFLPHPSLENQLDMNNVYDFIAFIHFDCISFIGDVWRFLKVDLRKLDIRRYCEDNYEKVISEVEDQILSTDHSELISIFLRTYYKEGLIKWFSSVTEKNRMLILLRIAEGISYE